ncbi:MAG: enoyl-CoA hydratase/isomerase family protein [Candidatus Rokubacteria bacterium]|nr:enoyl-CoA hydratase/isomerase family protein [Candidatus Rokubacteria bacterium]
MARYRDILYEVTDHVARVTINRPKQYNAFTGDTLKELTLAVEAAAADEEVGVIVLTGTGDKAFCAGGDVNWEKEGGLERQILEPYLLHVTVSRCLKPIIARVNGYCIGGGNHLAYFCDFTIAAEHAVFGQNGPRVGSPACGAIVSYLTRVIGAKRAREMWMLCRRYTARQALEMGLANAVVPMEKLDEEVDKWCRELLALSPTCLKILKATFVEEFTDLFGQGDQLRRYITTREFWEEEQQEGARAFIEKRPPDFSKFRRARR